ncbi:MAG: hypothetical protein MZV70_12110 [Desulfobacterales bacterium]|nr:hypothetical protein [Desulfobacterales bacterium]
MRFDVMDPAVIRGWVKDKDEVFSIIAVVRRPVSSRMPGCTRTTTAATITRGVCGSSCCRSSAKSVWAAGCCWT